MSSLLLFSIFIVAGYLVGSLSSAIIVCRIMKFPDPRTAGSNNPGATNVMRIGGKIPAYLTFVGDFLKGMIPMLIASQLFNNDYALVAAGLGAFIGHLYPLYFGFKGGKGVATLLGIIVMVNLWLLVTFAVVWLILLFTSGYVSVASMLGAVATAVAAFILGEPIVIVSLFVILAILIIYRHKSNIKKLRAGEELHFRKTEKT